jgi:ABC-2 type transport system permease protein
MTMGWKRFQVLQEALLPLVMVFAIAALPLLAVPGWFAALGRFFPVTSAVASLYQVVIARQPVTAPWGTGGLVWLTVTAAAYLAAGILVAAMA